MNKLSKQDLLIEPGKNEVEIIEIYINGQSYGVNISKVLRVAALREAEITQVADSHPNIAGITHVDGIPTPVIDLSKVLKRAENSDESDRRLLLVLEFNQQRSAYLIDGVNKIHRSAWTDYKPTSSQMGTTQSYISGTLRIEGKVILILDIEHLLYDFTGASKDEDELGHENASKHRSQVDVHIVEDSLVIRKRIVSALHAVGFEQLHIYENGQRAWESLKQPIIDECLPRSVIVTDVEMPEMDGLTLCRMLKGASAGKALLPVVVFSSLINKQMKRKCEQVGADCSVAKPDFRALITAIDQMSEKIS